METTSPFDLNAALRLWLERLGRSPKIKVENLRELESHVRDSVSQLQSKGLTSEESFLVATHRTGSPAQLESEFAKVNRSPWNMVAQGVILAFFSLGCWMLWGLLHLPKMMVTGLGRQTRELPPFTQFVKELLLGHSLILVLPGLAALYCACLWISKSRRGGSWAGFFAVTMATLVLLTILCFIAVLLPVFNML